MNIIIFFQNTSVYKVYAVPTFRPKGPSNQALALYQNSGTCTLKNRVFTLM